MEIAIFLFFFTVIFGFMIVFVSKKQQENKSQNGNKTIEPTDGNGRTASQNEYLNSLRVKKAEQNIAKTQTSGIDSHEHVGQQEHYDKIVGSLGEVNDEGCSELDGVRLITDDIAYDEDNDGASFDKAALAKAMVLGDVLNNPRFRKFK